MAVNTERVLAWIDALQKAYAENRQLLTDLDAAIGDADHGTNMERDFTAARAALDAPASIRAALESVAATLIRTVGGASGPLYGTFFLRAAASCGGKAELDGPAVLALFEAGIEGVRQRGKAAPGDKTMLDALIPALDAMRSALNGGGDLGAMLRGGADAAESGMLATVPLQARKGRASYLGPRSVGHQDPGATSSWMLLRAAAETLAG